MTEGNLPAKREECVNNLREFFAKNKKVLGECLPATLTPDLFIGAALTRIRLSADLQKCSQPSLFSSLWIAAQSGLDLSPAMEECDLIPRWNSAANAHEAQFQVRYGGLIKLVKQTGGVANIYAHVVCKDDDFDFALGDSPFLRHKPNMDGARGDGDILFAYAVAKLQDGSVIFEVMSRAQIEKIRSGSPAGKAGPWVNDYAQMCRKTAIRRLCKYLPKSRHLAAALEADDAAETGRKPALMMPSDMVGGSSEPEPAPKPAQVIDQKPEAPKPPLPKPQTARKPKPAAPAPEPEPPPPPPVDDRPPDEAPPPDFGDINMDFIDG